MDRDSLIMLRRQLIGMLRIVELHLGIASSLRSDIGANHKGIK